jgi:uncharacterized surface protein with fasciclin (FAS1) repeats
MSSMRWTQGLAAGLLALAVLAAACGGDEADAPTDASMADESMAEEPAGGAAAEPFGTACSSVPASGSGSFEAMMTAPVGEAAAANPLLTSLAMDLELAGLVDTLNAAPALTVFAPSNDAFAAAGEMDPDAMDEMMADPTGEFADILSYHVVEGQLEPDRLAGEHETLQGDTLTVEGSGEAFTVNGSAMVVCGAIHTDNATVYVIDQVLHPMG